MGKEQIKKPLSPVRQSPNDLQLIWEYTSLFYFLVLYLSPHYGSHKVPRAYHTFCKVRFTLLHIYCLAHITAITLIRLGSYKTEVEMFSCKKLQ